MILHIIRPPVVTRSHCLQSSEIGGPHDSFIDLWSKVSACSTNNLAVSQPPPWLESVAPADHLSVCPCGSVREVCESVFDRPFTKTFGNRQAQTESKFSSIRFPRTCRSLTVHSRRDTAGLCMSLCLCRTALHFLERPNICRSRPSVSHARL